MPKKHAAGKCGSCCGDAGFCWDCNVPLSISVDTGLSGGSGCCTPEDGTYVLPASGVSFIRCFPVFGPIINGSAVFGGGTPTCCPFSIVEPHNGASGVGIYTYACLIDTITCVAGSANHAFAKVLQSNMLSAVFSGKTATVVHRHLYQWMQTIRGAGSICTSDRAYVEIVDTFSRTFVDCADVDSATLNHDSRTRTAVIPVGFPGSFGGTGDTIEWGPTGDRRTYEVCAPKLISLNMP